MRVTACLLSIAVVLAAGCSSKGSGNKDASPADSANDPLATPPDNASPDRSSDPVAQADLVVTPDVTATGDTAVPVETAAKADLAGTDTTPPAGDARGDASARLDLVSTSDTATKQDVAPTPDITPSSDAPAIKQDTNAIPDAPASVDVAQTEAGADSATPPTGRTLGGCQILPTDHIFNTPIDTLPVHASSAAFVTTIGNRNIHLDLGTSTDMTSAEYYGIPYNTVNGKSLTWTRGSYSSTDTANMTWDPLPETDCVDQSSAGSHTIVSPCLATSAPKPWLPIPAAPLVEGGIDTDPSQPYGDHHVLIIDSDACRLWELYHCYPSAGGGWDIFGSATFDLNSNKLRPADWTSADAAGFPILPLLLLASEASSGEIKHALRFTISSSSIRNQYVWPARHLTSNGTMSASLPPMGQLFRIKSSYQIPSTYNTQSRAILQALKTYGMYIADGGSNMYIQGDPSAAWLDTTFSQVQSVGSSQFEAVDLAPIMIRAGFDPDSAAVPPP